MAHFGDMQFEIYLNGLGGDRPELPLTYEGLRAGAEAGMTPEAYAYVAGSSGSEATADSNLAAFRDWEIVPRQLRGITSRDLTTTICGTTMPAPVLLAPVGVLSIVHPEAELAVAQAAASLGVPMVLSTAASTPMEAVAGALGDSPGWYQLYWPSDRDVAASLVQRAEAAGYAAIVVTVDTWMLAWRPRDLTGAYLPFLLGEGIANYTSDPVFRSRLAVPPEQDLQAAIGLWASMFGNPALTWADLAWLREQTTLPILLKGISSPDDASQARDAGMAGVVVSNHGGRQVDGARASLACLPGVVAAVPDLPVLLDSGVRSGADIVKALALGAKAVLLGRPWVYGLALAGEDGVRHVLRCLLAELDITMALAGHAAPSSLSAADLVQRTRTR